MIVSEYGGSLRKKATTGRHLSISSINLRLDKGHTTRRAGSVERNLHTKHYSSVLSDLCDGPRAAVQCTLLIVYYCSDTD